MTRLRIGIITYRLDRQFTGIGRYTVELVKALSSTDKSVEIILLCAGRPGELEKINSVNWVPIPFCRRYPFLVTLGNLVIPILAVRHKLDLIYDPNGLAPFFIVSMFKKSFLTLHDVFPWTAPGNNTRLDTLVYRHWLPLISRRLARIITVSHFSLNEISTYLKIPKKNIVVIPPGVNPIFSPRPDSEIENVRDIYNISGNYILFVGSIEKRKNIQVLLKSCEILWERGERRELVLVGGFAWKHEEILAVLGMIHQKEKVKILGYVQNEHLPALYSGADIFVFPSIYEGFGLPLLEAMACGTPVICGKSTSIPEAVGDAAFFVDTKNPVELSLGIENLLQDDALREKLKVQGLKQAQAFTWEHTAEQILKVFRLS